MASMAADTAALLDALEIERAHVLGWSLGSAVAQELAVAERIPGARYELLTGPGSSHALAMERAEEFIALVLGFLLAHPQH